jgi:hypothetical protein
MTRVVVECSNAIVGMDRREALVAAGYDVTVCSGPATAPRTVGCPLRDARPCPLLADADVLVTVLREVQVAHVRLAHPTLPIVVIAEDPERRPPGAGRVTTVAQDDDDLIDAVARAVHRGGSP